MRINRPSKTRPGVVAESISDSKIGHSLLALFQHGFPILPVKIWAANMILPHQTCSDEKHMH